MHDALARALAAGATVVTPNRRLARHLIDEYDRDQRAAGKAAWPSARALPWPAWLAELEGEAMAAGASPPLARISDQASAELWRLAVEADGNPGIDARALAESAQLAWDHVHAYGEGGDFWRAWRGDDEPAAFSRWADHYRRALEDLRAGDAAGAAGRVARAAPSMPAWRGRRIVLAAFVAPDAGLRRVVAALREAGALVDEHPVLGDASAVPRSAGFASAGDELAAALAWARERVEAQPGARVGIVIPDLEARLPEVRRAARERLGVPDDESRSAAWNVSLGPPLADVPLVAAALGILALAWSSLPVGAGGLAPALALPARRRRGRSLRSRPLRARLARARRAPRSPRRRRRGARASRRPVRRAPGVAAAARATPAHRVASRLDRRVARRAARGGMARANARFRRASGRGAAR
jgi:hypothetical protein